MIWQRVQAVAVVLFVLAIGVAVAVLLMRLDRSAPSPIRPTRDVTEDIESAAKDPVGESALSRARAISCFAPEPGVVPSPVGPSSSCRTAGDTDLERSAFRRLTKAPASALRLRPCAPLRGRRWCPDTRSRWLRPMDRASCVSTRPPTAARHGSRFPAWPGNGTSTRRSGGAVSPKGAVDPGCRPVQLVRISDSTAKVFCPDGTIRTTSDGGATWLDVGVLKKVSSAVFTGPSVGFASTERPACKSRIQSTVDGGLTWTPRGCVEKMLSIPAFTATKKRLTAGGLGGVRLSGDGGATWKPPPPKF